MTPCQTIDPVSWPTQTSAVARWQWVQRRILKNPALTAPDILVACALVSHVNDRTGACYPTVRTLAGETRLSERRVRSALAQLAAVGLVAKIRHGTGRPGNRNAYRLAGLSDAAAEGSAVPAPDAARQPAPGAASRNNMDRRSNTDGRKADGRADERGGERPDNGLGATVLPAVADAVLIVARSWQRLCGEPWTLANACLRVDEVVGRVGLTRVRQALEALQAGSRRPTRGQMLDALEALRPRAEGNDGRGNDGPPVCVPGAPPAWVAICQALARTDLPGCRYPAVWLNALTARIDGDRLRLSAASRCGRDYARQHLLPAIAAQAERHGLTVGEVA